VAGLREVSEGAIVQPQQAITTVQRLDPLKVEFTLPEQYIGRIRPGDSLDFTVSGQMETRKAVVYANDPLVSQISRSMRIRATCLGPSRGLLPGGFAKISVPLKQTRSLLVPAESVVPVLKGKQVFVVRNGVADTVSIMTGVRTASSIQVISGLSAGDSVIVSGLLQLRPGSPVRVRSTMP
jgi:membrane fusion protein (multidrug efflux system)